MNGLIAVLILPCLRVWKMKSSEAVPRNPVNPIAGPAPPPA